MLGLAAVLAGCTHPAVTPKPPASQARENTVRDWQDVGRAIADRMAARRLLTARFDMQPQTQQPPVPPGRYFINVIRPSVPFLREVADALRSEILARGSSVATTPADALVVNLDVDHVVWSRDYLPPDGAFSLAGLAAGGAEVVARNGPYTPAGVFGMVSGVGIALDFLRSLEPDTHVEAVWKASIIQGDTYLMEATAPVYVRAGDLAQYRGDETNRVMTSYTPRPQHTLVQLRYVQ